MENGEFRLIPEEDYVPEVRKTSHQVLTDTIPLTWHPVTGGYCDSRTGMIKSAKAHGLEEWSPGVKPKEYKPDRGQIRELMKHHYEQSRYRSR